MPATKPTAKVAPPSAPKGAKPEPTGTVVVKGHKVPKSLAACADDLFTTRNQRLALDKQVESLKSREAALKEHLINKLPKSQASGISGLLARVTIGSKTKPVAADWDKIHKYIAANFKKNPGVFALLQRRLGEETIQEMWKNGVKVPGIEPMDIPTVSINKV
jgi:hypothetical protein